jgi:hypothetical protein
MDAKRLRVGMKVKYSNGNVVKVTNIPSLDKNGECFFSGILLETKIDFYKEYLNKNMRCNWNSAFCFPI